MTEPAFYRGRSATRCRLCERTFDLPLAQVDLLRYLDGEGLPTQHRLTAAQLTLLASGVCGDCTATGRRWRWWPLAALGLIAVLTLIGVRGCV